MNRVLRQLKKLERDIKRVEEYVKPPTISNETIKKSAEDAIKFHAKGYE